MPPCSMPIRSRLPAIGSARAAAGCGWPRKATGHTTVPCSSIPPPGWTPSEWLVPRSSDVVIVVTSPSPADLFTSRDTVRLLKQQGVKARSYLLFNQVQSGTILVRELEDMAQRIGLRLLKSVLHRRQAYQHAVLLGWRSLPSRREKECSRPRWKLPH